MKNQLLVLILFCIGIPAFAQDLNKEINSLEKDFKTFKYKKVMQKGRFLLADAYASKADSLIIFQYMLSSAYALNDTAQAKTIILEILKDQPDFSLNPKETSPKIVEFFNIIKRKHVKQPTPLSAISVVQKPQTRETLHPALLAGSILIPGSAHYFRGYRTKGLIYSGISAVFISSAVYFTFKTSADRESYLSASNNADYNKLYNTYNSSFKKRNLSFIGWGLWSLYCLYDFQKSYVIQPIFNTNNKAIGLHFQYHW